MGAPHGQPGQAPNPECSSPLPHEGQLGTQPSWASEVTVPGPAGQTSLLGTRGPCSVPALTVLISSHVASGQLIPDCRSVGGSFPGTALRCVPKGPGPSGALGRCVGSRWPSCCGLWHWGDSGRGGVSPPGAASAHRGPQTMTLPPLEQPGISCGIACGCVAGAHLHRPSAHLPRCFTWQVSVPRRSLLRAGSVP